MPAFGDVIERHNGLVRLHGVGWVQDSGEYACRSCGEKRWSVYASRMGTRIVCPRCVQLRGAVHFLGTLTLGGWQ